MPRTSHDKPVSTSTPNSFAGDMSAPFSRKRKRVSTSSEPGPEVADNDTYLKREQTQEECLSRSLPADGSHNVSSEEGNTSSFATTQDSTQYYHPPKMHPGPVATTTENYYKMGFYQLRKLCKSRGIKQFNQNITELRENLTALDESQEIENIAKLDFDTRRKSKRIKAKASAPPPPEQRTQFAGASAAVMRKEPASGDLSTVSKSQSRALPIDAQAEDSQDRSMERVNARIASEKGPHILLFSS